jgi:8-oxo-dGTP pyrophosphatase MutT (NUDIX family)
MRLQARLLARAGRALGAASRHHDGLRCCASLPPPPPRAPALGARAFEQGSPRGSRLGGGLAAGAVALACAAGAGGVAAAAPESDGTLPHRVDSYGGVVVDAAGLPADPAAFGAALRSSVVSWRDAGRRGVWLKLPLQHAALVPVAVAEGFIFHHAEPEHLMLARWLPAGPSPLPANASHQVGVGAFVLNAAGEVLVVQERSGPAARPGFWKLPTGLVNQGEEIHAAAVREVLEETGVAAEFVAVVGVRHAHGLAFGKDDLFFLCALKLPEGAPPEPALTPQEGEIAAAAWMPLHQFGEMPHVSDPESVWGHLHFLCKAWADGDYPGLQARSLPTRVPGRHAVQTTYTLPPQPKL